MLLLLSACARPSTPPSPAVQDPWALVGQSRGAQAYVERVLYEKPGSPHFFVHVRVDNHTDDTLGLDLGQYFRVLYPNQWGASDAPHRGAINEIRMPAPPIDEEERARLTGWFHRGGMTFAGAHGSVDYYRDFNASTRSDVEAQSRGARYVLLVMDGAIDLTDGTTVDRILPPADDAAREVTLEVPVPWKEVPAMATVIADR